MLLAAAYAFLPRPGPAFPATTVKIDKLLLLAAAVAGERVVAVGERGFIFLSDDYGASWRPARTPAQATLTAVYFHDARHGWAVGHDAVILRTEDGGDTWSQTHAAPAEQKPLLDVWFDGSRHGFAIGAYGSFYESVDGGRSWRPRKIRESDMHLNAIAGGADGALYITGEAGTVLRSPDRGRSWVSLASPYAGSFFGALRPGDGGVVIYGLRGKIYRSSDAGRTWKPADGKDPLAVLGGAVLGGGRVALVGQNGALWLSRDHGKSFVLEKTPSRKTLTAVLPTPSGALLTFGEGGVSRVDIEAIK